MRKGFSLIELLTVLAVLSAVSIPLARLTTTTFRDIPWSYRMTKSNTSILHALKQIRKDVSAAERFPESFNTYTTNNETLLIVLKEDTICYQLEDGKILRRSLANTGADDYAKTMSWPVPKAKIEWKVWRKNNKGYAVEVRTYIEHKCGDQVEKKFANSHLYFASAWQEKEQR